MVENVHHSNIIMILILSYVQILDVLVYFYYNITSKLYNNYINFKLFYVQ